MLLDKIDKAKIEGLLAQMRKQLNTIKVKYRRILREHAEKGDQSKKEAILKNISQL